MLSRAVQRGARPALAARARLLPGVHRVRPFYSSSSDDPIRRQAGVDAIFVPLDNFSRRHVGPTPSSTEAMLRALDPPARTLDEFVSQVLPADILSPRDLKINAVTILEERGKNDTVSKEVGFTESQLMYRLRDIAKDNKVLRSYIGCGYAGTRVPEVIKRNVLEGPGWYTSYTPYQPEISQGRLESLLNFQTLVTDLTGLSISNASVLDEATAAAEAMTMCMAVGAKKARTFFVSHLVHPQTIAVLESRADGFGIKIVVGDVMTDLKNVDDLMGVLVQYPDTEGGVEDFRAIADFTHEKKATLCAATDLLALTLLKPPGEWGADIAFGNSQRFGVPFGYGGPHAAFFACSDKYKRKIPGRLIGVSKDRLGNPALRLALQTREQHIRREKATSNICTAQALLANMSAFYAIYHGPAGLKAIAQRIVAGARIIEEGVRRMGFTTSDRGKCDEGRVLFDTVVINVGKERAKDICEWAVENKGINLRILDDDRVGVTIDETVDRDDLRDILQIFDKFGQAKLPPITRNSPEELAKELNMNPPEPLSSLPERFKRTSPYLTHPVFNLYHSETALLRYIHHLQSKDLSLTHSMIPLGSCTMKLNATTEMAPVTWPEFAAIHPFVPADQAKGYKTLIDELEQDLAEITGFHSVSLQPNSGAQGEFAGLRVIKKYLEAKGSKRDICLIPVSAHGTNPASAAMCGMRVVPVKCDTATGNLDMEDLKAKCEKHKDELGAIMITYPSTFGVFEPDVKKACDMVHEYGGQVYMDGANMNAQIGLCSPGEIGADVCHLNLHKTFCIPHGGGGPGVGPIGVRRHLTPFLPGHPLVKTGGNKAIAPISAAPWGSASILPISWAYIKMMGGRGLTHATKITLLNANYILSRLKDHYPILYTNSNKRCAHEFILDARGFKETADIEAIDIAKRLQDYGFHAPTMSWPVANTLMIEPTESENQEELDRFCDALIEIRKEIKAIETGEQPKTNNLLKNSPHSQRDLLTGNWERPYSREQAAYPLEYLREKKFWPSVTRLDDTYGDLNLFCTCASVEEVANS